MSFIERDKHISCEPDRGGILSAMGCKPGDLLYEQIADELDRLMPRIKAALNLRRTISIGNDKIYVSISAGDEISRLAADLFGCGEGLAGLLVNTAADNALFTADKYTAERIKYLCADMGMGISRRIEPPSAEATLSELGVILNKAPLEGVGLTDAFMLTPEKSMCYELELTSDKAVFNGQHDCSVCPNKNCPRRSKDNGKFDVVSDFDYCVTTADGVAIDIGTTTIAAMRFENGKLAARAAEINPQRRFGADVLSRIEAAAHGRGAELQSLIQYRLRMMIKEIGGESLPCVIAANTAMVSLYMGWDCSGMGAYPFKAPCLDNVTCGNINIVGGISSFVGGDITSGLYMCGFDSSDDINLFVDLGTNGEMAIGNRTRILCTSAAAGPAFEGGRISCGTGSVPGAVCAVDLSQGRIETIGAAVPTGLCGTGLTELVSELIGHGYIDSSGRLCDKYRNGYKLTEGIVLTQKDIREMQTAKSAIRAGIEILIREYGAEEQDIKNVYIAGGFGRRLNIEKSCRIGLLPERFIGRYKTVGNSALGGAVKLLEREDGFAAINSIKAVSEDFSLAQSRGFTELFIKHMDF